jgi:U3 small nucleolar RNA-associated protein 21
MKLNEVRKLHIPSHEGYGEGGFPSWGIPPGGTLDFEIEVLSIGGR